MLVLFFLFDKYLICFTNMSDKILPFYRIKTIFILALFCFVNQTSCLKRKTFSMKVQDKNNEIKAVDCLKDPSLADMRKRASTRAVLAEIFSNCGNYLPILPL